MTTCGLVMTFFLAVMISNPVAYAGGQDDVSPTTSLGYTHTHGVINGTRNGVVIKECRISLGYVYAIATKDDVAWIASQDGLYRIGPNMNPGDSCELGVFEIDVNETVVIGGMQTTAAAIGEAGDLWIGTGRRGVLHADSSGNPQNWFTRKDGIPSDSILSIVAHADGNIWAGTHRGAAVYRDGTWQRVIGIEERMVYHLLESSDWMLAGTDDGVYVAKPDGTELEPLSGTEGKEVSAMVRVSDEVLIASASGLMILYTKELSRIGEIRDDENEEKEVVAAIAPAEDDKFVFVSFSDGSTQSYGRTDWQQLWAGSNERG